MFEPGGPTLLELTRQALTSTRKGYDLIAPKFERTPFRTPDAMLDQVAAILGGRGPVRRGLDVCTGTGAGMAMLRPLCTEVVVGMDFSEGMLEVARQRVAEAPGTAALRFDVGNALKLEYDEAFELVTCFGAFGHIQEHQQPGFLQGIHRALVPGGRFAFATTAMPSPRSPQWWIYKGFNGVMRVRNRVIKPEFIMYYLNFTVPEILPMFERAGFDVVLYDAEWERHPYKIAVATKR